VPHVELDTPADHNNSLVEAEPGYIIQTTHGLTDGHQQQNVSNFVIPLTTIN